MPRTGDKGQGARGNVQDARDKGKGREKGSGWGNGEAGSLEGREGGCGNGWSDRAQTWAREKMLNNMGGNPCA